MKELLEYLIKNLVDIPASVSVKEISSNNVLLLEVSLMKEDIGKVVGKKGATINAIRTLIHSVASKNKIRVMVHIVE